MGIADWVVEMIWYRLRSLSGRQIQELINHTDNLETLGRINEFLKAGSFKYHVNAEELLKACGERAKEIQWNEVVEQVKEQFFNNLG